MPRRGQEKPPEPPTSTDVSFHFLLGDKLGETNSLLRALTHEVRALPYQMAMHIIPHLHQPQETRGSITYMMQLTQLLGNGKVYLVLIWRISLLIGLILLMAKGTFSAKDLADALLKAVTSSP